MSRRGCRALVVSAGAGIAATASCATGGTGSGTGVPSATIDGEITTGAGLALGAGSIPPG
jgi:hypothetical protein